MKLLIESLMLPLRHPLAVVKVLWPLSLFWVAMLLGWGSLVSLAPITLLVALLYLLGIAHVSEVQATGLILAALFANYFFLILARGAVQWHRTLILNEPIKITPLLPNAATWRYAGWSVIVLALGLLIRFLVLQTPLLSWSLPQSEGVFRYGYVFNWRLGTLLSASLIVIAFSKLLLRLPRAAVADVSGTRFQPGWLGMADPSAIAAGLVLLFLMLAVNLSAIPIAAALGGQIGFWAARVVTSTVTLWIGVAGLTLLSMMYVRAVESREPDPE